MKNKTLVALFLSIVPFVGLREGATSAWMSMPTKGIFHALTVVIPAKAGIQCIKQALGPGFRRGDDLTGLQFLPIVDPDFSDLDVRDTQNKPVKSVKAQSRLASLFMENLFTLTVTQSPHSLSEAIDEATLFLSLFKELFFTTAPAVWKAFEEAIAPSKRRFVHNVNNLWITLSAGILISLLLTRNYCFERSVLKLNLRC